MLIYFHAKEYIIKISTIIHFPIDKYKELLYYSLGSQNIKTMEMITMKKFISVALVLMLVVALATASFSADASPSTEGKYKVTATSEGDGTGSSDKASVDAKGNVTLTATENGGFFTKWIIDGKYDKVSGDEYSPVFVITPLTDINAIASFSVDKDYLTMSSDVQGNGTISINPEKVLKGSGDTVTLTATDGTDPFSQWVLACEYDIVEGTLTSKTLVIRPYTDVKVTAVFGENAPAPGPGPDGDGDSTSPKTGDNTVTVVMMILMAMAAGAFAVKKIKE